MQWLWCWRCKCEMPMLDEQEHAEIAALHSTCTKSVKRYREATGAALKSTPLEEIFAPLLNRYEALTGYKGTNYNAVMHHRLSLNVPLVTVAESPYAHRRQNFVVAAWLPGQEHQTEILPRGLEI